MGKLSERDLEQVLEARKAGILGDLANSRLMLHHGLIMGGVCSDGDQLPEMLKHLNPFVEAQHGTERIHLIAVNGGALVLSPSSPLSNMSWFLLRFLRDKTVSVVRRAIYSLFAPFIWLLGKAMCQDVALMLNISMAVELKGIKTVGLAIHAPCGAASICGMSFVKELVHLIKAKRRLEKTPAFHGVKLPCFCHIDYGDDQKNGMRKRTYFISTKAAEKWLLEHYPHALYS